jgi:hypothetical protein
VYAVTGKLAGQVGGVAWPQAVCLQKTLGIAVVIYPRHRAPRRLRYILQASECIYVEVLP